MSKPVSFLEHTSQAADRAKSFYAAVLGWTFDEHPMPDGKTYYMAKVDGQMVAGFASSPTGDTRPHWLAYLIVSDCKAVTASARAEGAKIEVDSKRWGPGTMSILTDPTGARVALWEQDKEA
jgi:uncharacterized protein